MAISTSPVDFAATRKAVVAAIAQATGLPSTKIVRAQAQGPVQPRPLRPFASFQYRQVGIRAGQDSVRYAPDLGPTLYRISGERGISVDVTFFADDQDDAYGLALAWQFGLSFETVRETLSVGGLCVWTVNDASDQTALLGSGFEARAFVECELWYSCERIVDLGSIDAVAITGKILNVDDTLALTTSMMLEAEG